MPLQQSGNSERGSSSMFGPSDTYIAVMGTTGSGKTTFISTCCSDARTGVSHSLKSETQEVQLYTFEVNDRRIHLLDTPGFDDTYRLDSDVLKDLAYWLSVSYRRKNIRLGGIVYLHPITHSRMTGKAFQNLRTFQKLVGRDSMSSVVLVTTMWNDVSSANGNSREAELKTTGEFWGDMLKAGSEVYRYENDYESAMSVIWHILNKQSTTVLHLQRELVDERKALGNTKAGREVDRGILEKKEVYQLRFLQKKQELEEAIAQKDKKMAEQLAKEQEAFQVKIDAAEQARKDMQVKMDELIKEKEAQYADEMASLEKNIKEKLELAKKNQQEFDQQRWQLHGEQQAELKPADEMVQEENLERLRLLQGCMTTLEQQRAEMDGQTKVFYQHMESNMKQQRQIDEELYKAAGGITGSIAGGASVGLVGLATALACVVM